MGARHRAVPQRLALQLRDNAQSKLRPHAIGSRHGGLVVTGHGGGEIAGRQDIEHGQGGLGADALNGLEGDEGMAFIAAAEAIERHARLLAPLGFDMQQGFLADNRQSRQGACAAAHDVADAGDVDQGVFLTHLGDKSAQAADHEKLQDMSGS